jgi:hypothetical protein
VADALDLRDISSSANTMLGFVEAPSNTSGTLTVTDGTHTANLLLLGQYVTANFNFHSDGAGGVIVNDPPVEAGNQFVTRGQEEAVSPPSTSCAQGLIRGQIGPP